MHLRFPKKRDFWSWNELRLVKYCHANGKYGALLTQPMENLFGRFRHFFPCPLCSVGGSFLNYWKQINPTEMLFFGGTGGNVKGRSANELI